MPFNDKVEKLLEIEMTGQNKKQSFTKLLLLVTYKL